MSGHSKWASIKHKKALLDKKRGKIFSKLVRQIQVAARQNPKPETNPTLRLVIEKAKEANMPSENIERAIKKATGEDKQGGLEEIIIEAYGPKGSAFIVEAITDNKNRTISEIKHIFEKHQSHLAEKGSVLWLFKKKVILKISPQKWNESLELELIDEGLEDISREEDKIMLLAPLEKESAIKEILKQKQISLLAEDFDWQPQNALLLKENETKKIEEIASFIEEHDDVKGAYHNLS